MLRSTAAPSATPIQFNARLNPFKSHRPPATILKKQFTPTNLTLTKTHNSSESNSRFCENNIENDWELPEEEIGGDEDEGCPWEGTITYRRNAAVSHLEYCTTLERLGLQKVSSELSRARASEMGLRVVGHVKDYPDGTPVLISVDVSRSKQKLRLDGIVRTVISLNCYRCGEPATQSVYADFSLLLCEEPIQEPETITLGIHFREDKSKTLRMSAMDGDYDEDSLIDFDDRLYFPVDMKAIDISKNIRDLVHVEITITALCDPSCKGLCLNCGINLNMGKCVCTNNKNKKVEEKGHGPLRDLRKQMQT